MRGFHQNESCLACPHPPSSYEGGREQVRGDAIKSGPGIKSSNFSANIRPTETYYIPNQWKLIKVFDELCRFKITALIEWDN